jgi:hypothetical protein
VSVKFGILMDDLDHYRSDMWHRMEVTRGIVQM